MNACVKIPDESLVSAITIILYSTCYVEDRVLSALDVLII